MNVFPVETARTARSRRSMQSVYLSGKQTVVDGSQDANADVDGKPQSRHNHDLLYHECQVYVSEYVADNEKVCITQIHYEIRNRNNIPSSWVRETG
jgi:hypothetical protein